MKRVSTMLPALALGLSLAGHPAAQASPGFGNQPNDLDIDASWVDEDSDHVDPSYLALKDASTAKAVLGHDLAAGDYYTYLRVKDELDVPGRNCGRQGSWSFVATATIDYVRAPGVTYRLVSSAPLIVVVNNYDIANKQRTKGCTYQQVNTFSGPYILYEAPRINYGIFAIDVDSSSITQPSQITLSQIVDLAGKIGSLWSPAVAAASPIVSAAAADVDAIRNVPSSLDHTYHVAVLPTAGITGSTERQTGTRISFASKRNLGPKSGSIIAYARKSASIVLDSSNGDVTEETVLRNELLGMPHNCLPGIGGCPNPTPFSDAAKSSLETDAGGDITKPAIWSTIFADCKHIRSEAKLLHLSPIDQLLVRWAMLVNANLLKAWSHDGFTAAWTETSDTDAVKKALQDEKGISLYDSSECWTDDDNQRLDILHTKLQRQFTRSTGAFPA